MSDWPLSRKIFMICMVIAFTIGNYIVLMAVWPTILDLIGYAQSDPVLSGNHASNFNYYKQALGALPWWLYTLPFIAGILEVFAILHARDIKEGITEGIGQVREGFNNRR